MEYDNYKVKNYNNIIGNLAITFKDGKILKTKLNQFNISNQSNRFVGLLFSQNFKGDKALENFHKASDFARKNDINHLKWEESNGKDVLFNYKKVKYKSDIYGDNCFKIKEFFIVDHKNITINKLEKLPKELISGLNENPLYTFDIDNMIKHPNLNKNWI